MTRVPAQIIQPELQAEPLWAVKPAITGTMIKGASPGASNLAGVVWLTGVIDLDVAYQSVIDPDVTLIGAIEL